MYQVKKLIEQSMFDYRLLKKLLDHTMTFFRTGTRSVIFISACSLIWSDDLPTDICTFNFRRVVGLELESFRIKRKSDFYMKLLSSVLLYGATDALKCQVCTENR